MIYGIEHFEFSCSSQLPNNGSLSKWKENEAKKLHTEKVKQLLKHESIESSHIYTTYSYDINASIENYFENFNYSFNNHANKIEGYHEQIKKDFNHKNMEISLGFIIEDNSINVNIRMYIFDHLRMYTQSTLPSLHSNL